MLGPPDQESPSVPDEMIEKGAFSNGSLYVGDLSYDVNEAMLYDLFSSIGPVASIRVCRDSVTRKSLRYAYINYHSQDDAAKSINTLNHHILAGQPIRIMWVQRDPAARRSGTGNVFVKNLDSSITNKMLSDVFESSGRVVSCKVATDEMGRSHGYGFVQFETIELAEKAIIDLNGVEIKSKPILVTAFVKKSERDRTYEEYTNIYVRGFPIICDQEEIDELFKQFGKITSSAIKFDASKQKKFAFINYEEPQDAKKAVDTLNNKLCKDIDIFAKKINEKKEKENENEKDNENIEINENGDDILYVVPFQARNKRVQQLKQQYQQRLNERREKFQGLNLYVKNLDESITDDMLRKIFEPYGTITSAKVMLDEKDMSRGFGFVCFENADEATNAVTALHQKSIRGKPLYVGLAERREQRVHRLQQRFRPSYFPHNIQEGNNMNNNNINNNINNNNNNMKSMIPNNQVYGQNNNHIPTQSLNNQSNIPIPRGFHQTNISHTHDMNQVQSTYNYQQRNVVVQELSNQVNWTSQHQGQIMGNKSHHTDNKRNKFRNLLRGTQLKPGMANYPIQYKQDNHAFKFTSQARNRTDHMSINHKDDNKDSSVHHEHFKPSTSDSPLTAAALATAQPPMQKQMLGEKLFPLIAKQQPELAGKITGMMLEMDNSELLLLMETEMQLKAKIDEALIVLQQAGHV